MRTMRLVVGIISIVLSLLILLQSCAASCVEAIVDKGGFSGATGLLVAVIMLSTGIVAIAARKSKGATVYCTIAYAIAGLLGILARGVYKDLVIWGGLAIIFATLFFISIFTEHDPSGPPPPPQHWNYPHY